MRNATKIAVSTFGALAGLVGIEHGIGEIVARPLLFLSLLCRRWLRQLYF